MAAAQDALRVAAGEIGYSRWDDPQQGTKYGRWYAEVTRTPYFGTNGVPYCAMFVSWVLAQVGQAVTGFPTASCTAAVNAARGAALLVDKRSARPGDLVVFDWNPSVGDGVDHIGFVEFNKGSYIQTIEGNTSPGSSGSQGNGGGVYRRTRDWSVVAYVIRPNYGGSAPAPAPQPSSKLEVDGWIGTASWTAMQTARGCSVVDGVMSSQHPSNKPYLLNAPCVEWGYGGSLSVESLQSFLRGKGYDIATDGYFGPNTVRAVQRYMRDYLGYVKHAVDRVLGPMTAANIQNGLNAGGFR